MEDIATLRDTDRHPPNTKPFGTDQGSSQLDCKWKPTSEGPHTFEVKFEAGITRREALKVMHRNWLLILREVEAEAHLDHREELKAAASMAEFRGACKRSIQEDGLDDSGDEH